MRGGRKRRKRWRTRAAWRKKRIGDGRREGGGGGRGTVKCALPLPQCSVITWYNHVVRLVFPSVLATLRKHMDILTSELHLLCLCLAAGRGAPGAGAVSLHVYSAWEVLELYACFQSVAYL